MDLFVIATLLLLGWSFTVFPHTGVSAQLLGTISSIKRSTATPLVPGVPRYYLPYFYLDTSSTSYSRPIIILALVLDLIGMISFIPLVRDAACRWPTKYRAALAAMSLLEVGQGGE